VSAPAEPLEALLTAAGLSPLDPETSARFADYLELLLRWNARLNLTAVREPAEILSRHFLESIACARNLPEGISTLLDLGSGAGFPGIPIALCRPDLAVTLAESQNKKSAFLQEAVRTLGLKTRVHAARAETLKESFDAVALRAVDRMRQAVQAASVLVRPSGWLLPMTTLAEQPLLETATGEGFQWQPSIPLPGSDQRILARARRDPR
jgi:16S rRNA (guanine527-N7)-methyltransferase